VNEPFGAICRLLITTGAGGFSFADGHSEIKKWMVRNHQTASDEEARPVFLSQLARTNAISTG